MRAAVMRRHLSHDMTTRIQPRDRIRRRLLPVLVAATLLAVVGCGQGPDASPGSEASSSTVSTADVDGGGPRQFRDESWGFPACDDVPYPSAPSAAYRDEPVHVVGEAPLEEVRAWARSQPGYEGIWIDHERNGWITVAFSRDAEARQEDLEEEFAGVGVVAVPVHSEAELSALADRVRRELAPFLGTPSTGLDRVKGVAGVYAGVLTEEARGEIERRFSGEPLCVSGFDPATVPAPGLQPSGGEGWRLLADEAEAGEPWRIGLAADAAGLAKLWAEIGLDAPVPEVDFEEHVAIWFGAVVSSGCPDVRLDDVVVDGSSVYAELVDPNPQFSCPSDAVPHAYVVALERSRLPSGPVTIRMPGELSSSVKSGHRLRVNADLSEPGAVVASGAVLSGPPQALPRR